MENETYMHNDFPTPRRLEPTYEQFRYNNIARYVKLSRAREDRAPSRLRTVAMVMIGIAAALFLTSCLLETGLTGPLSLSALPFHSAGSANASTPRAEWALGKTPYLYQTDPAWANLPYADGTIETHGCGPTCLSMAYVQLTGKTDRDPARMAEFSESSGFIDAGVTSWLLMSEGARMLGLSSHELSPTAEIVSAQICAGHPIICSVAAGDFTTTGHFIVLCGLDDQGKLIIRDPNSPERSQRTWDIDRVLAQCRNLWALS